MLAFRTKGRTCMHKAVTFAWRQEAQQMFQHLFSQLPPKVLPFYYIPLH